VEVFLNMQLISTSLIDEAFFSVEKQNCWSWILVFKCWIIKWWIKEILVCNYLTVKCLSAMGFILQLWSSIMWNVWDASKIEDNKEHVQ
jgi:hypothetical protein